MAGLARVGRLSAYEDISLIANFAERFGIDPDEVYWKTSFWTLINFSAEQKERMEFRERFDTIWKDVSGRNDITSSNSISKHGNGV